MTTCDECGAPCTGDWCECEPTCEGRIRTSAALIRDDPRTWRCKACGCKWGPTSALSDAAALRVAHGQAATVCPWCSVDPTPQDDLAEGARMAQLTFDRSEPR